MKEKPELNLFQKSLINILAFAGTVVVFSVALGLSPILILFYIIYNIVNNIKHKGDAAADKWAANGSVSLPHAKLL